MDTIYWIITLIVFGLVALVMGKRIGLKSQAASIQGLESTRTSLEEIVSLLQLRVQRLTKDLEASSGWIEVPVTLHGFPLSEAAHTFVQLHTKTLEIRASQMTRLVMGAYYAFPNQPRPVLGSPEWHPIKGRNDQVLILGQVYSWSASP